MLSGSSLKSEDLLELFDRLRTSSEIIEGSNLFYLALGTEQERKVKIYLWANGGCLGISRR